MQRKFLTNIAFLIFINFLIKPFWILGIDRTVQNTVGPYEYGLYFAILNFSFLFQMLLDFGVNNFNSRAISRNQKLLPLFLPNIFLVKIILSGAYLVISYLIAQILGFSEFQLNILFLLILNQILASFALYFRSNIGAMQRFKTDAVLSVLDKLLMILIVGVLLWGDVTDHFELVWFIYAQTVSYFITALISLIIVLQISGKIVFRLKLSIFKKIMKLSYPFALLGLLMTFYNRIDGIMIERLIPGRAGAEEAGIYAASFRLLDAMNMIGYAFATILLPMYARLIKKKEEVNTIVNLSAKTLGVISVVIIVSCFFYRMEIMELLYHQADEYYGNIFGLLITSFFGVAALYIFGTLLNANGSMKQLNIIALAGAGLNIVLNYFLILKYHALGATVATVITQFLIAFIHIYLAKKYFQISLTTVAWKLMLLLLSLITLGIFSRTFPMEWWINFSIIIIAGIFIALILRLWDIRDWMKEIKQV